MGVVNLYVWIFPLKKNSIQQNYPPSLKQVMPLVQVSAVNIWFVFKNSIVQYHYILNLIQHHSISRIWETLKPRLHCEVDTFTFLNLYSPQWISLNLLPDRVGKEFELETLGSFMCLCIKHWKHLYILQFGGIPKFNPSCTQAQKPKQGYLDAFCCNFLPPPPKYLSWIQHY